MTDYLKVAREILLERQTAPKPEAAKPLEAVLKGQALELWSDALGERFWLVADEDDAVLLGEPRGTIYTPAEARRVVRIADPSVVAELHRWKRQFNARLRDCQRASDIPMLSESRSDAEVSRRLEVRGNSQQDFSNIRKTLHGRGVS